MDPLTARGEVVDGSRLSGCSFSDLRRPCPAIEISVPESGRVNAVVLPFNEVIWISMVGADSNAVENTSGSRLTALVTGGISPGVVGPCCLQRLRQTLAK